MFDEKTLDLLYTFQLWQTWNRGGRPFLLLISLCLRCRTLWNVLMWKHV